MATIGTSTNTNPVTYPSQAYLERSTYASTAGYLWSVIKDVSGNLLTHRSIDGGTTWGLYSTLTRANVQEYSGIVVDAYNWMWVAYRTNESSEDRVYFRRQNLNLGGWEAETRLVGINNGGVAGLWHTGLAIKTAYYNSAHYVVVAAGTVNGANRGCTVYGGYVHAGGQAASYDAIITGSRQWLFPGSGRITPALDFEHTGDGKSSNTPHLWLAFGRGEVVSVKLAWSGGRWSGPVAYTTVVPTSAGMPAQDGMPGRWDGTRFLMCAPNPTLSDCVSVYERNQANSTTTTRTTPAHPTGVIRSCTLSYNATTQDVRVYAVGTSSSVLYYVDFVRLTGVWSAWATVTATAITGTGAANYGVRQSSYGNAKFDTYTSHSGAPNTIVHNQQSLSYPPNTPTWSTAGLPYVNGSAADVAATLTLDWVFSDPDPADVQTAYALSRQVGAGTLAYFRASDSTWQATEQKNLTATTQRTLLTGWASAADDAYAFRVKVWDGADIASGYSDTMTVIPSAKVAPSFTAPASGGTITTDTVTVSWTVAEQTQYRLTLTTNPGGVVGYDSGWVTSTATTVTPSLVLADLSGWTIGLTTKNNEGLASTTITRNFTVDYLEPAVASLVASPQPAAGYITVAITNPAPSGGQPAVTSQELWRRPTGGGTDTEVRVAALLASGATVNDFQTASGQDYQYRVLTRGTNGTSIYSSWAG